MALVGTIAAGHLSRLLDSIIVGRANMLLMCERGERMGRVEEGLSSSVFCRTAPTPMDEIIRVVKDHLE